MPQRAVDDRDALRMDRGGARQERNRRQRREIGRIRLQRRRTGRHWRRFAARRTFCRGLCGRRLPLDRRAAGFLRCTRFPLRLACCAWPSHPPRHFAAMLFCRMKRVKLLSDGRDLAAKSRAVRRHRRSREGISCAHTPQFSARSARSRFAFATPSFAQERTVKITGFGAKSGVVRVFGINSEAAMKAAAEEINKAGGVTLGDGSQGQVRDRVPR